MKRATGSGSQLSDEGEGGGTAAAPTALSAIM